MDARRQSRERGEGTGRGPLQLLLEPPSSGSAGGTGTTMRSAGAAGSDASAGRSVSSAGNRGAGAAGSAVSGAPTTAAGAGSGERAPPPKGEVPPADEAGWTTVTRKRRKQHTSPPHRAASRVRLGSEGGGAPAAAPSPAAPPRTRSTSPTERHGVLICWRSAPPDQVEAALQRLSPERRKAALLEMAKWDRNSVASRLRGLSPAGMGAGARHPAGLTPTPAGPAQLASAGLNRTKAPGLEPPPAPLSGAGEKSPNAAVRGRGGGGATKAKLMVPPPRATARCPTGTPPGRPQAGGGAATYELPGAQMGCGHRTGPCALPGGRTGSCVRCRAPL